MKLPNARIRQLTRLGVTYVYLSILFNEYILATLLAYFIQVSEINTHSPFSIGFFYQDEVREPIRVLTFLNEISFE